MEQAELLVQILTEIRQQNAMLQNTIDTLREQSRQAKAAQIHAHARQRIALVPKSDTAKLLVREAVAQLNVVARTVEFYRAEMNRLALSCRNTRRSWPCSASANL